MFNWAAFGMVWVIALLVGSHCGLRIFHVVRFGDRIWVHETGNATCALHSAEPEDGVK